MATLSLEQRLFLALAMYRPNLAYLIPGFVSVDTELGGDLVYKIVVCVNPSKEGDPKRPSPEEVVATIQFLLEMNEGITLPVELRRVETVSP